MDTASGGAGGGREHRQLMVLEVSLQVAEVWRRRVVVVVVMVVMVVVVRRAGHTVRRGGHLIGFDLLLHGAHAHDALAVDHIGRIGTVV